LVPTAICTLGASCPIADADPAKIDNAANTGAQMPNLFMITFATCSNHKTKMRNYEKGLHLSFYGTFMIGFGSLADMCGAKRLVRFTPESGHVECGKRCPLCAISGHRRVKT
jgi:hypothetical protein